MEFQKSKSSLRKATRKAGPVERWSEKLDFSAKSLLDTQRILISVEVDVLGIC